MQLFWRVLFVLSLLSGAYAMAEDAPPKTPAPVEMQIAPEAYELASVLWSQGIHQSLSRIVMKESLKAFVDKDYAAFKTDQGKKSEAYKKRLDAIYSALNAMLKTNLPYEIFWKTVAKEVTTNMSKQDVIVIANFLHTDAGKKYYAFRTSLLIEQAQKIAAGEKISNEPRPMGLTNPEFAEYRAFAASPPGNAFNSLYNSLNVRVKMAVDQKVKEFMGSDAMRKQIAASIKKATEDEKAVKDFQNKEPTKTEPDTNE